MNGINLQILQANQLDKDFVETELSKLCLMAFPQEIAAQKINDIMKSYYNKSVNGVKHIFFANVENQITGFAYTENDSQMHSHHLRLGYIYVIPTIRSFGIGTALLEAIIQKLQKVAFTHLEILLPTTEEKEEKINDILEIRQEPPRKKIKTEKNIKKDYVHEPYFFFEQFLNKKKIFQITSYEKRNGELYRKIQCNLSCKI